MSARFTECLVTWEIDQFMTNSPPATSAVQVHRCAQAFSPVTARVAERLTHYRGELRGTRMTPPALVWRPFDARATQTRCSYHDCDRPATLMRGPRSPMIRLPWRA